MFGSSVANVDREVDPFAFKITFFVCFMGLTVTGMFLTSHTHLKGKVATIEDEKASIENDVKNGVEKTIENIRSNFNSIRTYKSNSAMLDKIDVEYYGSPDNLKSIAQISNPDANSLLVQPYDKSSGDIITCNLWQLHAMKFINYYKKLRNGDSPPTVSRSWYGSRLLIGE
ncbi:hypothetical protein Lal_00016348 [Lupinus albus]|nr:hypothetical protein Lal_00016348 [Lupinus albus]